MLAHWVACCWWPIGGINFKTLATPITASSSGAQRYFTCLYWSLTTLLRVPSVTPTTALSQLYTCLCIVAGTIAFAVFNAEVHHIVRTARAALQVHCTSTA